MYQEIMNLAEREMEEGSNPEDECSDNTEHIHGGVVVIMTMMMVVVKMKNNPQVMHY